MARFAYLTGHDAQTCAGCPSLNLASEFTEVLRLRAVKFLLSRKLVRTIEDGEDAVQDAMLSAWKHQDKFAGHSKFSSWFTRIAINAALMRKRHDTHGVLGHSLRIADAEWIPAPARNIDPFRRKQLVSAIRTLSVKEQRAFIDSYGYGFTRRELATTEGVKSGAIKSRAHRARKKLRRVLQDVA